MEKSSFRMEISPFWMEKIPCRGFFPKKNKNASEKHLNGEISVQKWRKFSVDIFFKVQNTSEKKLNGEISIQNGDFSILNGENYLWSLFFKKKVQNTSEKNWMEKFSVEIFFWSSNHFWKKHEWINLHSEWRFLHSEWRKFPVDVFSKKQIKNASEKHLNGEISIQNGDF